MYRDTVVVVEDNDNSRKLVCDLLRHIGFRAVEATSAGDGVRQVRALRPAAVVMDLWLPDYSGFQALQEIRGDDATRDTPILAVTAAAMPEERRRMDAAGFDACLTKPIDVLEFMATVRGLVERFREREG